MSSFLKTVNGTVPVFRIGTLCLITFLATTSQYVVLVPWFEHCSRRYTLYHLVPFNLGIILIYWTFYLACQDPGAVRADYLPPDDGLNLRYCKTCEAFKPPRSHHCKTCRRCISRMDHHCPWLSSCVGYQNHAAFIKFMLCVVPTTTYLTIMMASKLWETIMSTETSVTSEPNVVVFATLNLLGAAGVSFTVFCLLVYQLWNISENITTIESWSKKRTEALVRRNKIPPIEFPYDLYSISDNLKEILGHHHTPLLWLWPPTRATESGHVFPVNEDSDPTRPWPPKDPTAIVYQDRSSTGVSQLDKNDQNLQSRQAAIGQDEFSFEDYASMGMISDSEDSSEDYVDGDGENLDSYGVDDEGEITLMNELIGNGDLTVGQVLQRRRKEHGDMKEE